MTVRLRRLEIEGFRGFARRQALDLDADAIVVRGGNGRGKTSLVEALLWLVTGRLEHLEERVRSLRKTEDAVTNRFAPDGATVALTVVVDGRELTFTRTGGQRSTSLAGDGDLAAIFGCSSQEDLEHAVRAWGVLRQDAVRAALDDTGGALHERIAGLVGLERISDFAAAATTTARALVRERTGARAARVQAVRRYEQACARRDAAQAAAAPAPDIAALLAECGDAAIAFRPDGDVDAAQLVELGRTLSEIAAVARTARERRRAFEALPGDLDATVTVAEEAVAAAERAVVESNERSPAIIQLATTAVGLLEDRCPVCDGEIDPAAVRARLDELLATSRAAVDAARVSQDALVAARGNVLRVREQIATRERAEAAAGEAEGRLKELVDAAGERVAIADPHALDATVVALRELHRTVTAASGAEVARLSDAAEEAAAALRRTDEELEQLESRIRDADALKKASSEAARAILEEALHGLQPSFAEVFDRLAPSRSFTELQVGQDVLRSVNQIVPRVHDRERGITANPLLVFSEGQLNVVALSYFLGMVLNARDGALPFLVLDDPLQALDLVAILGFSDLCRRLRDQRQLIVTTHDRRFGDLLVRKLTPRDAEQRLIVHDFVGWTREGPIIRTERPAPEAAPMLLEAS